MNADEHVSAFMRSHPITADRIVALERFGAPTSGRPLLSPDEWVALKQICVR